MAIVPLNPGLFAVLAQSNSAQIGEAIERSFPGETYALAPGQWLISAPGKTTQQIAALVGLTAEPSIGAGIVLSFGSYFGRANPQIWEWIAAKMGTQRG